MSTERAYQTSTLLANGKVLITGGSKAGSTYLNSAELYSPTAGTFAATNGNMANARDEHTATLLSNGKVLIAGGFNGLSVLSSAELYDPTSGNFSATNGNMTSVRYGGHTATLLSNGKVLITGGRTNGSNNVSVNSAELYDPGAGTFSATNGNMTTALS